MTNRNSEIKMIKSVESKIPDWPGEKLLIKNSTDLNRFYLLVAFILYPCFALFLYQENNTKYIDIAISLVSGLLLVLSYYSERVKKNLPDYTYIFYYFIVTYISTLAYLNNYNIDFTFGLLAVLLFSEIMIETRKKLFWFTIPVVLYTSVLLLISKDTHIGKLYIVSALITVSFFVYFVLSRKMKIKNQLENTQTRLSALLNNLPGVILFETGGGSEFITENSKEILGYSADEFKKDRTLFPKLIHEDDRERTNKLIVEWHKQNEPDKLSYEFRFKKADGSWVWIQDHMMEVKPHDGNKYMAGVMIDITDRKQAEEKLKENEEKFRLLFSKANDSILIMNGMCIIDCNEKTQEMFGCTPEEIKGKTLFNFSPEKQPDRKSSVEKGMEKIKGAMEGKSQFFYWKNKTKNGTLFDAEVSLNAFNVGNQTYLQAIVRDITERKESEKLILESEERFRLLSEATMEGIVMSEKGNIVDANDQYARIHGFINKEEVIGKKIEDFIAPDFIDIAQHNIETGYHRPFVIKAVKRDGSIITVEARGQNIPWNGKTIKITTVTDITERIGYETELRESQELYRSHIESLPDGILIIENNKVVFANASALKILGTSKAKVKRSPLADFILPEYKSDYINLLTSVGEEKATDFIEIKIKRHLDNKIADIQVNGRLVKFKGEESIQLVVNDISTRKALAREQMRAQIAEETNLQLQREIVERKKTQNKLATTQKFNKSIIESSLDMIVATDIDSRINEFNLAAQKSFGYTREEVLGKPVSIIYADEEEYKQVQEILHKEGVCSHEIVNKRKDGSLFISFLSASSLKDEEGNVFGAMGVSRDITAAKKAEEELRLSEERHRAVYDQAYIGIARIGRVGRFLLVNERLCDMFGYTSAELYKKAFFELTHPSEVAESLKKWDALLGGEIKNFTSEQIYVHKNGSQIYANLTVSLVRYIHGSPNYYVAVFEDITLRKQQEKELQESLKEREVLLKEVHHRVKNNMQVISSILNLQSSYIKDEAAVEMLKESQDRIKTMAFIHESLYQGKNLSHVKFYEYVKNLVSNLFHSYGINKKGVRLEFDLDEVFLKLDTSIPCGLIINELISNALKYAFTDRETGVLSVTLKKLEGGKLKLVISDDGKGFPTAINWKDTESLGLQLVVTLAGQIRGDIQMETKKGTTFTIIFNE